MTDPSKPAIIHLVTSVLAGWNLLVFTVFLILFGLTYLTNLVIGQVQDNGLIFWVIAVVAMIAGIFTGFFGGKRLHRYFSTFQQLGSYLWLAAMAYLAFRTLPIY